MTQLVATTHKAIIPNITQNVSSHLAYLDGLRALAASYVLVHHAAISLELESSEYIIARVFAQIFAHGRFAVDFFIVISGFCLMLPVVRNHGILRGGTSAFLKRRANRILPTYFLAFGFSLLLIYTVIGKKTGTNWDVSIPVSNWDIITHIFLIQDFFHDTIFKINHTFWSISVEWHIYFLFPLLVVSWRKYGPILTTIASIILSLALWYILGRTQLNVYGMSPHYIALFTFGMLAAHASFSGLKDSWKIVLPFIFAFMAITVHPILTADFIMGIIAACLLVGISTRKQIIVHRLLCWKPLVFIGTFAYSIYLIHAPLVQIFTQYIINPFNLKATASTLFMLVIGVPAIIGISYLFYLVGERPFVRNNYIDKLTTKSNFYWR